MNSITARFALVLAAIGWGSATTATKYALDGFGPSTLLLVKLAAAALVLWAVLAVKGVPKVKRKGRLAWLGLFEPTLAYGALTLGLAYTTATNGSLLGASEACFVVALAAVFLKERIGARSLVGLLLAFVGVLLIEEVFSVSPDFNVGDMIILGGNLAAAIYVILAAKVAPTVDSLSMTSYQFLWGVLLSLPFAVFQWSTGAEAVPVDVSWHFWVVAAMIGGVGFAGSFLVYNYVIKFIPAGLAGVTLNLVPLFGVLTAIIFLGEHLTFWTIAGGIAVIAGIMMFPGDKKEVVDEPETVPGQGHLVHGPVVPDGRR
ncbi:DMT family transporter [Kibdelosporangium persicum]|uniref:Threonine/homoserine efflux transporter RhtA n=1 Tax=Kibdelosporangium persicum TaxID=2698649 RepID=A0ABX2EVS4_9PSEU|nr:DMT family transporter [Kibdelosporangium persicum]NRN62852.1 Threonine/homoserine efflux transporter RhtA [Kibdelosporangium persicum]